MGGKDTTFEELTGKTNASQGSTNALGQQSTTPKEAGTVSFEELMGRARRSSSGVRQEAAARQPIAQAPENVFGAETEPIHTGSAAPPRLPRFGLNFLHTYWEYWDGTSVVQATKYGGGAAPYADAGEVGATITRQVGLRDLMWARLASQPTSWHGLQTGQPVQVNVAVQLADVRRDGSGLYNHEWLSEALTEAHAAGVKVLLTFGAMSAESLTGLFPAHSPTAAGEWEETITARDGNTYSLNQQYVFAMNWSENHIGRSLDGHAFPVRRSSALGAGPGAQWHLQSLDVSCGYKRAYLRRIAEGVGDILCQVDSDLRANVGCSLEDVVEGIELFNEVEHGNQYVRDVTARSVGAEEYPDAHPGRPGAKVRYVQVAEPYESSYRWGRACFQAAYGLRVALGERDDIKIRLPGICSYSEGLNDTWEDRRKSMQGLVAGFVDEAVSYLSDTLYGPGWSSWEILSFLPRVLQGIDYHCYHTDVLNDEGHLQHVGYLVCEVPEIEQTLLEGIRTAWYDHDRDTELLSSFPVSVLESGTTATDASSSSNHQAYVPLGVSREQFQAFEVIRRLGGALASGASMLGWHSWMSNNSGAFACFGLRDDVGDETALVSSATQRLSWFAYQRFTELFAIATSGGMVLPQVASRAELVTFLGSRLAHPFVVLRYEGLFTAPQWLNTSHRSPEFPYAWLLLRDPSVPRGDTRNLHAFWTVVKSSGVAVVVSLFCQRSGVTSLVNGFPDEAVYYAPSAEIDLGSGARFALDPEDGPVLLFSDEEIEWKVL